MRNFYFWLLNLSLLVACSEKNARDTQLNLRLHGEYLGQELPGDTAKLFAPKFVSTGMYERDAAFSPDGKEFYFSVQLDRRFFAIAFTRQIEGVWQKPEIASFSGKYMDGEPVFHPDGTRLFFASNRVDNTSEDTKDYDIWFVERRKNGRWGEPLNLGEIVNSSANEFYPSFNSKGTLYFCSKRENSIGGEDIYRSECINGDFQTPENLGEPINTTADEYNAFISPDDETLMYTTHGYGQGMGGGDLFVAFKNSNGVWEKPINCSRKINSPSFEYCPSITPDGKYIFFTSHRMNDSLKGCEMTYESLYKTYSSPQNGNGDIYWINASVINALKIKE